MDATEVKALLEWTDTKHDAFLAVAVPALVEFAIDKCENDELDPANLPGGVKLFVAKSCEYMVTSNPGLEARTLGDASYNFETGVPKTFHRYLKPYRKVRMK